MLDKADTVLVDETETADCYGLRLSCWQLTAEQQTSATSRRNSWHVVGGGAS